MKILNPRTVTDEMLISTNVHEVAPALWSSGTTYAAGVFIHIVNGIQLDIYESLQGTNLNKAPGTETDWWRYRSCTYPEYASGTTWALGDRVIDATDHKEYESLQADNLGHALTETTWWKHIGATMPWRVFDKKLGRQTERTGSITYTLAPGIFNSIAIFNIDALTVRNELTDPTDGLVYDETVDLISTANVYDGYTYCFAEFLTTQNLVRTAVATDIPPYGSAELTITFTGADDTATVKCGEIAFGPVTDPGQALMGSGFEFVDYTIKEPDDYGDFDVVLRPFSKRISVDMEIPSHLISYVNTVFENTRGTPMVWIVVESGPLVDTFLTYGFCKGLRVTVPYDTYVAATVDIEGLNSD